MRFFGIRRVRTGELLKVEVYGNYDAEVEVTLVEDPNSPVPFLCADEELVRHLARRSDGDDDIPWIDYQEVDRRLGFNVSMPLNFRENPDFIVRDPVNDPRGISQPHENDNPKYIDDDFEVVPFSEGV